VEIRQKRRFEPKRFGMDEIRNRSIERLEKKGMATSKIAKMIGLTGPGVEKIINKIKDKTANTEPDS
jgi:transposase